MRPTLVACSHGTSSPAGQAAISALVDQVRGLLPDVRVEQAFVDVEQPDVSAVVADLAPAAPVVVVPVLLSTGFHTRVDIARAVASFPGRAVATAALGPHDLLALTLESRLADAGVSTGDAVVLAAAGSTDPAAAVDVGAIADLLARRLTAPVSVGFAAGAGTRIADAVAAARDGGARRVAIASYLLAPGFFADVLAAAGADIVTEPLAPDVRVATIIAERYAAASALLAEGPARVSGV